MTTTKIEWTRNPDGTPGKTWNPLRGCSLESPGCSNCYAMRQAHRFSGKGGTYEGLTKMTKGGPVWTGKIRMVEELLEAPLSWKKPVRIFVNSMSDLFHEDVPDHFIDKVFAVMESVGASRHTFQVLTKRAQRMRDYVRERWGGIAAPVALRKNIWLGVSVEDQRRADERLPLLLETPAAVRWISAEPLLGLVDLLGKDEQGSALHSFEGRPRLDWVVVGGESGPGSRPMHPSWVTLMRDQCAFAGVPFFFKQWGTWFYEGKGPKPTTGRTRFFPELDARFSHWSKRSTGRILEGRTHDGYPA